MILEEVFNFKNPWFTDGMWGFRRPALESYRLQEARRDVLGLTTFILKQTGGTFSEIPVIIGRGMRIDLEIEAFLMKAPKKSATRSRDIDLVLYFYGFKGDAYPTLEDAGRKYGVGTGRNFREHPRQIVQKKFKDIVNISELPSLRKCESIIKSVEFISLPQLNELFVSEDLVPENGSLRGVLELLHFFDLCKEYDIYDTQLRPSTRQSYDKSLKLFLSKRDVLINMRSHLYAALAYPGRVGIAKIGNLKKKFGASFPYLNELVTLLKTRVEICYFSLHDDDFYLAETRRNALINSMGKIQNIAEFVDLDELVIALSNGFKARTAPLDNEYPEERAIREYLLNSAYTALFDRLLKLKSKPVDLSPFERDVLSYLRRKATADFKEISKFLLEIGYSRALIQKGLMNSPLVFVDKTKSRPYLYRLVGSLKLSENTQSRYELYKERLLEIASTGTELDQEAQARREHRLLADWLFDGKSEESCALCGESYAVKSLVSAHKKIRADCAKNERLDPYIVMPLCKYGCDYIYERGYVWIENERVNVSSTTNSLSRKERLYVFAAANRRIDDRWLKGNKNYFRKPQQETDNFVNVSPS